MQSVSDSIVPSALSNSPSPADRAEDFGPADELAEIRFRIIRNLATALETATARLARSATGEAVFTSDADYTHNSALLKSLPTHLEQINTLIADLVDAALDAALNPKHDAASPDPQF
jgi:hypothetical protein